MSKRVISQAEMKDALDRSWQAIGGVGLTMLVGVLTARAVDAPALVPFFGVVATAGIRRWVHPGARLLGATLLIAAVWLTWWGASLVPLDRVAGPNYEHALRGAIVEGILIYAPAIAAVFVTGAFVSVNHSQHLARQPVSDP